jgi:hypothetical protein
MKARRTGRASARPVLRVAGALRTEATIGIVPSRWKNAVPRMAEEQRIIQEVVAARQAAMERLPRQREALRRPSSVFSPQEGEDQWQEPFWQQLAQDLDQPNLIVSSLLTGTEPADSASQERSWSRSSSSRSTTWSTESARPRQPPTRAVGGVNGVKCEWRIERVSGRTQWHSVVPGGKTGCVLVHGRGMALLRADIPGDAEGVAVGCAHRAEGDGAGMREGSAVVRLVRLASRTSVCWPGTAAPLHGDARWPVQKKERTSPYPACPAPTVRAFGMRHAQTVNAMVALAAFGVNPDCASEIGMIGCRRAAWKE